MEHRAAILAGARTPFGRTRGALARLDATALARACAASVLDAGSGPVDAVVLATTWHQHEARAIADGAAGEGIPLIAVVGGGSTGGLEALHRAALAITRDGARSVLVVGVDSSSSAPHLLPGSTRGARLGHGKMISQVRPEAFDVSTQAPPGVELRQDAGGLVAVTPKSRRPVDPIEKDDAPNGSSGDGAACLLLGEAGSNTAAAGNLSACVWASEVGAAIAALAQGDSSTLVWTPSASLPAPPAAVGLAAVLGALDAMREDTSHENYQHALAVTAAAGYGACGVRIERGAQTGD